MARIEEIEKTLPDSVLQDTKYLEIILRIAYILLNFAFERLKKF